MGFVTSQQTTWNREDNRPFVNDSRLTRPTRIKRVGRGFIVNAHAVQMGETVITDASTAADLIYLGKAALVE